MELNKATTLINSNQENNELLFNAIKNKFDAKSASEVPAASPPKFNIPLLKIPGDATLGNIQTIQPNKSPTQLNKFLIKQLQEKHSNNGLDGRNTEFVLPHLTSPAENNTAVKYELPAFQTQMDHSNICSLTTAISKLKVQENSCKGGVKSLTSLPIAIDLTTALATKVETHEGTPTRDLIKPRQKGELDFEIPFIDCDRQDISKKSKMLLPASNEYCVKDVSKLFLQHSLAEPSAIGRCLSSVNEKYSNPLPLKYFTSQFRQIQVKHSIEPFQFETQSPDDVVLLALSKSRRRHYK